MRVKNYLTLGLIAAFFIVFASTIMIVSASVWDSSNVDFEIRLSETVCNQNGDTWLFPDGSLTDSLNSCKLSVGSAEKICCPLGYNCEQSAGIWNCVANATFTCFDY